MLSSKAVIGVLSALIVIIVVAASLAITFIVKRYKRTSEVMKEQYAKLANENKLLSSSIVQATTRDKPVSDKQKEVTKDEIDYVVFENTGIEVIMKSGDVIRPEITSAKIVFPSLNKEYLAVQKSYNLDPIVLATIYALQKINKCKDKYGEAFNEKYYSLYSSMSTFIDLYATYLLLEERSKKGMTGEKLLDKAVAIYHAFACNHVYQDQFDKQFKLASNKIDALKYAITTKIAQSPKSDAINKLNELLTEYSNTAGECQFNLPKIVEVIDGMESAMKEDKSKKHNVTVEEQPEKDNIQTISQVVEYDD